MTGQTIMIQPEDKELDYMEPDLQVPENAHAQPSTPGISTYEDQVEAIKATERGC